MTRPPHNPIPISLPVTRLLGYLKSKDVTPLVILLLLSVFNVLVLQMLKEYPFTDLPNHLAEATIYKFSSDSSDLLTKFFRCEIELWKPNIGHLMLYSLFPTAEGANAVCYSLYMISVPLLIAVLIRLCRGDLWFSILSCLTLYNFNACWGFLGFTLAIPLVLLCLIVHIVFSARNSPTVGVFLSVLMFILFYMHVLAFLFVVLCFLITELAELRYSGKSYSWARLLVIIPGAVLFLVWYYYGEEFGDGSEFRYLRDYYLFDYPESIVSRLVDVFFDSNHIWFQHGFDKVVSFLFSIVILGWVLCIRRNEVAESQSTVVARRATVCFTSAAAFCYIILPSGFPGQPYLNERYLVFVFLGFICILSWGVAPRFRRVLKTPVAVTAAIYCILCGLYLLGFKGWTAGFEQVMDHPDLKQASMPAFIIGDDWYRGHPALIKLNDDAQGYLRRILQKTSLDGTNLGRWMIEGAGTSRGHRHPTLTHFNNYHIVRHHGITPTAIVDHRFGAVRRRSDDDTLPFYVQGIPKKVAPALLISHYADCDYIVAHGPSPFRFLSENALCNLIYKSDGWALFKVSSYRRAGNLAHQFSK